MIDIRVEPESASAVIGTNLKRSLTEAEELQYANAVGYSQYLEALNLEFSEKEAVRVRWKIDFIIIPIFLVTQALQFMDKTSLNYANLFGYKEALGLQGNQFNYLSAMVYAGYFFGQYPCGWLIGRYPAQKIMGASVLLWGITWLSDLGSVTCLWAVVIWFCLPDSPSNAYFLSHRERLIAVKRVASNETGIKNKTFNRDQVIRGITDPKTILIFISVFAA
ncbi:hypothetical protein SLS62_001803 [Diatrype stigma]|uniref:Uncharacterized protein n=1 Tax=Diatrype stigma TaxID=117547 RepID=A0AAN9UVG8_9PEZI